MTTADWEVIIADNLDKEANKKTCEFLMSFRTIENDLNWTPDYFIWKLKRNPAGNGCMTLAVSGKKVVGTVTATPKRVWYQGEVINSTETGDTYTAADFQRKGIFSTIVDANRQRSQDSGYSLVYGTPNEQSRPAYEKKLEFLTHPQFSVMTPVYLRKLPQFVENRLPWIFSYPISMLIRFMLRLPGLWWLCLGKLIGASVKQVDSIGSEYDKLWEECRDDHDFLLVRDQKYLNHRFFQHPFAQYQFFEARKQGKLGGYLVTRRRQLGDRNCCIIADWFYDTKHPLLFLSLLNTAIHYNSKYDVGQFSAWVTKTHRDKWLFALSGFILRGRASIIFHKNSIGNQILNKKQKWHFTIADSDNV